MNPTSHPHGLLAWAPPTAGRGADLAGTFRDITGLEPLIELATGAPLWVWHGSGARVGHAPESGVTVVLVGDLLDRACDPAALARSYGDLGAGFARDLRGSWAALVHDPAASHVLAVTDRLNARRLFHARDDQDHWLSTDLGLLPDRDREVDPVAVAWFLSNGAVHCQRTPFRGVSVLPKASVHTLAPSGVESQAYWQFHEPNDLEPREADRYGTELVEILETAVRRCVEREPRVWLSLSGGYDSRALAGFLKRAGPREVECFSYAHGPPADGMDAAVGARIAAQAGYPHRVVESYEGDPARHVADNARFGRGVSPVCDEIDGWRAVAEAAAGPERPVLLTGDHIFPDAPERKARRVHPPPPGKLRRLDVIEPLVSRLSSAVRTAFEHGMGSDFASLHGRISHAPEDTYGFFYMDQRLPNVLLAWRSAFAGRWFDVRSPFLDYDVLDYLARVPGPVRRSTYYHDAVARAFPSLFALPLAARGGYAPNLKRELSRTAGAWHRDLSNRPSRLDDVVPPDIGLWLLEQVAGPMRPGRRLAARAARLLGARDPGPTDEDPGAPYRPSPAVLLRRYLVLRRALTPDLT